MHRTFIAIGATSALLAVIFGAFAAHGLKTSVSDHYLDVFKTSAQYQMYHSLGLILIGVLYQSKPDTSLKVSAWLMMAGIILFSGSLYALVLSNQTWLGMITPIGGTAFIIGWAFVVYSQIKS